MVCIKWSQQPIKDKLLRKDGARFVGGIDNDSHNTPITLYRLRARAEQAS
eukprot:gene3286-5975_t